MKYKYLYGPVPSRRLGFSLGVDLVPFKTCSLDCVYCQLGRTTNLTIDRKEYSPTAEIIDELNQYLKSSPSLDFITFSGSGEPTLHSRLGEMIGLVKENYPQYKVAVLTNGTLFCRGEVREEVKRADLLVPSLDAVSEPVFKRLNGPHHGLNLEEIISGLIQLRNEFEGEIWLEVFIVPNLNDSETELQVLKEAIERINPDKVQLNTLDRPGAESWVVAARKERLEKIASYLPRAEVIAKFPSEKKTGAYSKDIEASIVSTLKRRPCTALDLSRILNLHLNEVNKYLHALLEEEKVKREEGERGLFFRVG
ncbi:MAG: radical SAM protein [Candidatus Zixiibacteriota bacterium]|nr:MAG: radical SAM protein [candidate division Zixibacteria bacterium]